MKFTWLLFFRILQAILDILMNLPDNIDPREVCREMKNSIDGVAPSDPDNPTV